MIPAPRLLAALSLTLLATPTWAASSAVASAVDSVSTSVGSISRSFKQSSDSSSKTVVGQGTYEVVEVAQAEGQEHDVTLQAVPGQGASGRITLRLGPAAVADGALAPGRQVTARERPYGWEFARADTRAPFFLLLADDWFRELHSVPLEL
jgi:hypothetical protein